MGKKVSSKSQQGNYTVYKNSETWKKNRKAKIERHLKKYPNDACAQAALKAPMKYGRKKPKAFKKVWNKQSRWYAQILSELGYNGMIAIEKKPVQYDKQ